MTDKKYNKAIDKVFDYLMSLNEDEFKKEINKKGKYDWTDMLMRSGFIEGVQERMKNNAEKTL